MNKLKSRKFWLVVIGSILMIANDGLGLGIDSETVLSFAGLILGYVFGEAYIDGKNKDVIK